jgi:hypothetical protein
LEMRFVVAQCAVSVTENWTTVKSTWPLKPFCVLSPNTDTFHYMYFPDDTAHVVFSLLPLLRKIKQNIYQINNFLVYCYFTLWDSSQRSVFLELKCSHSPCTNLCWLNSHIYQIRIKALQPFRLQQDAQTLDRQMTSKKHVWMFEPITTIIWYNTIQYFLLPCLWKAQNFSVGVWCNKCGLKL